MKISVKITIQCYVHWCDMAYSSLVDITFFFFCLLFIILILVKWKKQTCLIAISLLLSSFLLKEANIVIFLVSLYRYVYWESYDFITLLSASRPIFHHGLSNIVVFTNMTWYNLFLLIKHSKGKTIEIKKQYQGVRTWFAKRQELNMVFVFGFRQKKYCILDYYENNKQSLRNAIGCHGCSTIISSILKTFCQRKQREKEKIIWHYTYWYWNNCHR